MQPQNRVHRSCETVIDKLGFYFGIVVVSFTDKLLLPFIFLASLVVSPCLLFKGSGATRRERHFQE